MSKEEYQSIYDIRTRLRKAVRKGYPIPLIEEFNQWIKDGIITTHGFDLYSYDEVKFLLECPHELNRRKQKAEIQRVQKNKEKEARRYQRNLKRFEKKYGEGAYSNFDGDEV